MAWQHTIYAYPMLFATAVSLLLGGYALHQTRRHGRTPTLLVFAAMNVAIAIWTGLSALKLLSTVPAVQFHTYRLLYLGSSSVGPLLLLFVLAYTDRTRWLRPRVVLGLFVVPITFWILLFTNPYDVVIVDTRVIESNGLLIMRTTTGPAHVALSFTYALTIAVLTLGVILVEALRQGRTYLPQATLLSIAIVTPITVSFLTSANVPPFTVDNVNFVPASTAVSSIAIGIATVRYRLLDLQPIAYRTVVKDSPDGVLVLDQTKRIVHANDTASSLLASTEPVVGQPLESLLPAVDLEHDGHTPHTIEATTATGDTRFFDVRSQPLRRHGDDVGWVLILRDITELRQRQHELEAFTGVVSHDLREPLRTIEQYLELLEHQSEDTFDDDDIELLTVARSNARRMQVMITDLLQYSQVGSTDDDTRPVDCERLVEEVLEGLRFEIEEQNATVEVGELPTVDGVDHLLRRLFQNLLSNALTHSDVEAPTISIRATPLEDAYEFTVSDDGKGIPPAEQDRVFELFTRGSESTTERGAGMGLALCNKIVEHHGGQITLESTPNDGTEVTFTIPASTRAFEEQPQLA